MKIYDTNSNDDTQSSVTDIANAAYVQFYVWYILPARDHLTGNIQSWSHKFQPGPKNMPPKNMPSKQKKRAALRTRDENSSRGNDNGATTVKVVSSKKQKQNKTNNKNNNSKNCNNDNNTGNDNDDDVVIQQQKPPTTLSSAASFFLQQAPKTVTTTTTTQQPPATIGPNNISHQASDVSSSLTGTPQDLTNEINCEIGCNNNNGATNDISYCNPTPASAKENTNAANEVYCDWNREQHGILTTVLDDKKRTLQRYVRETLFAQVKFITCDSDLEYKKGKCCNQPTLSAA